VARETKEISNRAKLKEFGSTVVQTDVENAVKPLTHPLAVGDSYYEYPQKKVDDYLSGNVSYDVSKK